MPDSLRKMIGAALLVLTIGVASCQAFLADDRAPETLPPPAGESESG